MAFGLIITKVPEGGYLVSEDSRRHDCFVPPFMFACTTIDEALKFIKSKCEPKVAK